jgi:hypothetical protein
MEFELTAHLCAEVAGITQTLSLKLGVRHSLKVFSLSQW